MIKEELSEKGPGQPTPGENNPNEAITTPHDVEESNDDKINTDFPGFPHYPAKEEMLDPDNSKEKVEADKEAK